MAIRLKVDVLGEAGDAIDEALTPGIRIAVHAIAREALRALQSPSSPWPVRTGFSKANFGTVIHGDTVDLVNVAEYAPEVETRTHAAERAIRNDLDTEPHRRRDRKGARWLR